MIADPEKQKTSENEATKWQLAVAEGPDGITHKLGTKRADRPTEWSGSMLKREIGFQARDVYPPMETMLSAELLASDPTLPQSYTYARLLERSADCYHIVVSGEDATANVARNIPLSDLNITVGEGGELTFLMNGTTGEHKAENLGFSIAQQEKFAILERCREAASNVRPDAVIKPAASKRRFGSSVLGRLRNR